MGQSSVIDHPADGQRAVASPAAAAQSAIAGSPCGTDDRALGPVRVLLIIPAFNEAENLPAVIAEIRDTCPAVDFVIVNDGSTDNTSAVARRLGALVLDCPINLGIGGAVQCGIRFAFREGYDICVQCDGDGQHDPRWVADLVRPIVAGEADMVVGSRFLEREGFQSTGLRRAGIRFLSEWIRWFSGQRITDPTSGFRAMGRSLISEFAARYPREYPEPESVYVALHRGYRLLEVRTVMRPRRSGRSSIQQLDSVLYILKICLAILADRFRDPRRIDIE